MATITIRRQVVDVEFRGAEADGMQLQRRLPALCADVISPALESALAPFDTDKAHLFIDLLDVDLGDIPLDRFESEVGRAVRREVELLLQGRGTARGADSTGWEEPETAIGRRSTEEAVHDALVWFLRTGRLPWSFRLPPGVTFERVLLDAWTAGGAVAPPRATLPALAGVLRGSAARTRLVRQFSPQFAVDLLRALSGAVALASGEVMTVLVPERLSEAGRRAFAHRVWDAALLAAASGDEPSAPDLVRSAWAASSPFERSDSALSALLEARWPGIADHEDSVESTEVGTTPRGDTGGVPEEADDGILVEQAGLVLLHPFLPQFLGALGVALDDELLDPERALCLLHTLATGELIAPEHQLTVAKVLCGVPLDQPVTADAGITVAEVEEATALLDAVILHWEALGHASAEALRGEFVAREGVLAMDPEGDWLLRIEGRAVDVLLDRLPWGISLIQLPWMPRMLRVEWR